MKFNSVSRGRVPVGPGTKPPEAKRFFYFHTVIVAFNGDAATISGRFKGRGRRSAAARPKRAMQSPPSLTGGGCQRGDLGQLFRGSTLPSTSTFHLGLSRYAWSTANILVL